MTNKANSITEYRNYLLPADFPVLLLHGDHWKISDIPSGRLHFHNCLEIGVCHLDSGTMVFFDKEESFKAGDVVIVPRNVPHTTYSDAGKRSHWSYIFIDTHHFMQTLHKLGASNYDLSINEFTNFKYIFHQEDHPEFYPLIQACINELLEKKENYQIRVSSLLLALFISVIREEKEFSVSTMLNKDILSNNNISNRGYSVALAPALDFIDKNYSQQFSIEYLAKLCHWSPTHFRRVFNEVMNTSPLEYVNQTRVMRACALLRNTDISILDISEQVGFHSVSSFNRSFLRYLDCSPGTFRKKLPHINTMKEGHYAIYSGWLYPEEIEGN